MQDNYSITTVLHVRCPSFALLRALNSLIRPRSLPPAGRKSIFSHRHCKQTDLFTMKVTACMHHLACSNCPLHVASAAISAWRSGCKNCLVCSNCPLHVASAAISAWRLGYLACSFGCQPQCSFGCQPHRMLELSTACSFGCQMCMAFGLQNCLVCSNCPLHVASAARCAWRSGCLACSFGCQPQCSFGCQPQCSFGCQPQCSFGCQPHRMLELSTACSFGCQMCMAFGLQNCLVCSNCPLHVASAARCAWRSGYKTASCARTVHCM
ncbi:hypothetical protein BC832DRAFT_461487 [Gaertneriomyces semiglobifer]|nr:hypothetical protein BC832DRAFT_461487 [Gaertneriomyces semiglobifer]